MSSGTGMGGTSTFYIRYADDFVILSSSRLQLKNLLERVRVFLKDRLKLDLHPHKVHISTLAAGVDFLGWVHFPTHRVLRTTTRRRMVRNLAIERLPARVQSYKGMLSHGDAHELSTRYLDENPIL